MSQFECLTVWTHSIFQMSYSSFLESLTPQIKDSSMTHTNPVSCFLGSTILSNTQHHHGPLAIEEQFPEIVPEIERILYLNGYAAHKARHDSHNEHFGTTMFSLVAHLLETFPALVCLLDNYLL